MQSAQYQLHAQIEERHWWFVARRRIVRSLIETVVPAGEGHLVIDVGCGTGANVASLRPDYRVLGIDTSAEAIDHARARFAGVRFVHGYAPQDVADDFADARLVMLNDVLEHVPDDFEMLSSLLSAASPGTYFLLTVPAEMELWSPHDVAFGHYRRYDLARFAAVWEGLPVSTLLATPFNSRLYPLVRGIRAVKQRRSSNVAAASDFSIPLAPVNSLLQTVFAGERSRLVALAKQHSVSPYRRGVSLIALLRREAGWIDIRRKPDSIAPDLYLPTSG